MPKIIQNLSLLVISTILSLFITEIVSRFFLPLSAPNRLPFIVNEGDSYCGYHPRPNQRGFEHTGSIKINQWGFRGNDWKVSKPPDAKRIIILGDSYAFGQGVADDETFAAQLEIVLNMLPVSPKKSYQVLNFAVSGYDTGHEIKVLKHHALQFQPDVVLLQFFLNDLSYVDDYSFYPVMFAKMRAEFSTWKWQMRECLRRSSLLMALWDISRAQFQDPITRDYINSNIVPPAGSGEKGWKFVIDQLRAFREIAKQHHFKPVLLIMPTPQEIIKKRTAPYVRYLQDQCTEIGLSSVNLQIAFESSRLKPKSFLIPYDYHLTAEGHRLVAKFLLKTLLNFLDNSYDKMLK